MRSSIACVRCRRSKVKCINNGIGSTCRSCDHSNRECVYPQPATTSSRRRESLPGRLDGDGERRQRPRKSMQSFTGVSMNGPRDSPRPPMDALDPRLLTSTVWQELYDIFELHFSADLPFLHSPPFLKSVRDSQAVGAPSPTASGSDSVPPTRPRASQDFLLAFLALTARFHPKIVAHHSPRTSSRSSNPLIASEYYAAAAHESLTRGWMDNRVHNIHDIERTQATLMLGLHEWGMCRGAKAWVLIGIAIRSAQAMGLQYELDLDDEPMSRSVALSADAERNVLHGEGNPKNAPRSPATDLDPFVRQEIRRRTFWSCFIMDRYLSSGKYRPQMLHARELRIQLPASERSFMFAEKVRTLMLGEEEKNAVGRAELQSHRQASVMLGNGGTPEPNMAPSPAPTLRRYETDDEKGRLETGAEEGLISRYIKILEIYGKVVKWSCAGGRRVEEHPPWDRRCEWNKLYQECLDFKSSLPRQHALTPQNTQAHLTLKTSTPYALVHTVYNLCQIMLHREYVPFVPIRCSKPEGPLDPPTFSSDKYDVPPRFWDDSAQECFKAAREIIDLIGACQGWSRVVETPIVGFAIYTVTFVGVYCISFPWMDSKGYMCTPPSPASAVSTTENTPGESKGFEAAKKSLEILGQLRTRLHMADGWFKTINRMHKYFRRMKSDYRKNMKALESGSSENDNSPISTRHLSLREGGIGGGLVEFKMLERTLQEFGNLDDSNDVEMTDADGRPVNRPYDGFDDSSAATTVKSEEAGETRTAPPDPQKSDSGTWNPINTLPGISERPGSTSAPGSAPTHFRPYESFPQILPPPQPSHGQHSGHQTFPPPINNFRPSYSQDPNQPGGPPSLASPASRTASSQSQPSPPFDPVHGTRWAPQNQGYPMQATPPSFSNGMLHYSQPQQPMVQNYSNYPTPGSSVQNPHMQPPLHGQQDAMNQMQKEPWNVDTRLGGDDFAAFVDGNELDDWANMSNRGGLGGSWLSAVWGGGGTQG